MLRSTPECARSCLGGSLRERWIASGRIWRSELAASWLEAAATAGTGDFVAQVASELPLQAIAGLLGVPFEDRSKLFHWTNNMVGDEDPEFAGSPALESAGELMFYGMQLAAYKPTIPATTLSPI